jgi:hypothetical protein
MPSLPLAVRAGDSLAAGHRDFDDRVDASAEFRGDFFEIGADHRARGRIDRGLADWQRQTGPGHRANAFAGLKAQARASRREANSRYDQRAMGDVRIVARVLDDPGAGEIGAELMGGEGEFRPQALGQRDGNGIGKTAGQQRFEGGASRACRAGAGGPAAPQGRGAFRLGHALWRSARQRLCLERQE